MKYILVCLVLLAGCETDTERRMRIQNENERYIQLKAERLNQEAADRRNQKALDTLIEFKRIENGTLR